MKKIFRNLIDDNGGQSIVLFALGMAVFIGFAAISVEYGYIAAQKRTIQNAADAGALAGAQVLYNTALAETTAEQVAEENKGRLDFDSFVVTPTVPYHGDRSKIEVAINATVPGLFSRIWGNEDSEISARAVAQQYWNGQFLPLVNTAYVYEDYEDEDNEEMVFRTQTSPGDKSQIFDYEAADPEFTNTHYIVHYEDGITVDKGNGNTDSDFDDTKLNSAMDIIFNPEPPIGTEFYLFSLRSDLIDEFMNNEGELIIINKKGEEEPITGSLDSRDTLRPEDLVILKVSYQGYDLPNYKKIRFHFVAEYTLLEIDQIKDSFVSSGNGYSYLSE